MKKFVDYLIRNWIKKENIQLITGRDKDETDVYMVRYILLRTNWLSIYIHQFLRSDSDSYHDHPWNFWTYIVSGKYTEHTPDIWYQNGDKKFYRSTEVNRLAYRKSTQLHWVEIDRPYKYEERFDAPTTICFIGRRHRAWGFIDKETGQWTFWKKYLKIPYKEGEELGPSNG